MHELSIALNILDLAAEEAQRLGAERVLSIHLRLGPLAGVVKEALLSAFEIARADTALTEAQLLIEEVEVLAQCPQCQAARPVVSLQQLCCADCGTPTPELVGGQELEIVALEIQ